MRYRLTIALLAFLFPSSLNAQEAVNSQSVNDLIYSPRTVFAAGVRKSSGSVSSIEHYTVYDLPKLELLEQDSCRGTYTYGSEVNPISEWKVNCVTAAAIAGPEIIKSAVRNEIDRIASKYQSLSIARVNDEVRPWSGGFTRFYWVRFDTKENSRSSRRYIMTFEYKKMEGRENVYYIQSTFINR